MPASWTNSLQPSLAWSVKLADSLVHLPVLLAALRRGRAQHLPICSRRMLIKTLAAPYSGKSAPHGHPACTFAPEASAIIKVVCRRSLNREGLSNKLYLRIVLSSRYRLVQQHKGNFVGSTQQLPWIHARDATVLRKQLKGFHRPPAFTISPHKSSKSSTFYTFTTTENLKNKNPELRHGHRMLCHSYYSRHRPSETLRQFRSL